MRYEFFILKKCIFFLFSQVVYRTVSLTAHIYFFVETPLIDSLNSCDNVFIKVAYNCEYQRQFDKTNTKKHPERRISQMKMSII